MAQIALNINERSARTLIVGLELLRVSLECLCDDADGRRTALLAEIEGLRDDIEVAEIVASLESCQA